VRLTARRREKEQQTGFEEESGTQKSLLERGLVLYSREGGCRPVKGQNTPLKMEKAKKEKIQGGTNLLVKRGRGGPLHEKELGGAF